MKCSRGRPKQWISRYVTMHEPTDTSPDLLFVTIPPVRSNEAIEIPKDILNSGIEKMPNLGLAFLATQIKKRSPYVPSILYGHQIQVAKDNGALCCLGVEEMAQISLLTEAKVIGLSLMSPLEISFAKKFIKNVNELCASEHRALPTFICGGAQPTLDRTQTARFLKISDENVIPGRALPELLTRLDRLLGGRSQLDNIDYACPTLPDYLFIPNGNNRFDAIVPIMNVIGSGGKGCINGSPCSYCTAFFLGRRILIPEQRFRQQIEALSVAGIKSLFAADNTIDASRLRVRQTFLGRVQYAQAKGIQVSHFLSRPDFMSQTPSSYLKKLHESGVDTVLMGIESANPETLRAMNKIHRSADERAFIRESARAVRKVVAAGLRPTLSVILGFPVKGVDSRIADRQTLYFLRDIVQSADHFARVEIHLLFPAPGSKIHSDLIEQGAEPENLYKYMEETDDLYRKFRASLEEGHRESLDDDFGNASNQILEEFVSFSQARREALNLLLNPGCAY